MQQQLPKSKRRRPPDAFLSERWGWLKDIAPEDRSWLHFAMFTAYQLQVPLSAMLDDFADPWLSL